MIHSFFRQNDGIPNQLLMKLEIGTRPLLMTLWVQPKIQVIFSDGSPWRLLHCQLLDLPSMQANSDISGIEMGNHWFWL
jgi:hypothetical protein